MKHFSLLCLSAVILLSSCNTKTLEGSYGADLKLLQKHKDVIVLKTNQGESQIAIVQDYQGRVMTSTAKGPDGRSFGWINPELIASGEFTEHYNVFGGEDRFWIGPEGGQYSIFFENGKAFNLDNWYTPPAIDTEPFELISKNDAQASFRKKMNLKNYSGATFDLEVEREVSIFTKEEIEFHLNSSVDDVHYVGYQSVNQIKNTGQNQWKMESGLLSIWILGMFNSSDYLTVIIPYKGDLDLNTSYFGEVGPNYMRITDDVVLFKGDGTNRSKIGLQPKNIIPVAGSFDSENNVLTIVQYSFAGDTSYVNSLWRLQEEPYKGDVVNSYNDGPLENGDQLGPFYEIESSSPAKELMPGEAVTHVHKTYHFEGDFEKLNEIAIEVLGFDLTGL